MADYAPFIFGGGTDMSYEELKRRQAVAAAVASQRRAFPKTLGEGMTYLGESIGDRMYENRLREAEARQAGIDRGAPVRPDSYRGGGAAPAAAAPAVTRVPTERIAPAAAPTGAIPGARADIDPRDRLAALVRPDDPTIAPQEVASLDPTQGAVEPPLGFLLPGSQSDGGAGSQYRSAIGGIESSNDYSAVGVPTKYGRAIGRYGVIEANIPKWTTEALGQSLTPEQFKANPSAQDAVFDHKFGQYVAKYGPEKAARAWYGGEGNINNLDATDAHEKLSVYDYGKDFINRLRGRRSDAEGDTSAAPVQLASLGGTSGTMTDAPPIGGGRPSVEPDENEPTVTGDIRPMSVAPNMMAQVGPEMFSPRRMSDVPSALGAAVAPPTKPPGTVVTDIKPAPNLPPSQMKIPSPVEQEMAHPGPEPTRPSRLGPSPAAIDNWAIWNDPRYSDSRRARAKEAYQEEERFRGEIQSQQQETYKDLRERWQQKIDAYDKFKREANVRRTDEMVKLLGIEQAQIKIQDDLFARGVPREQAIAKAANEINESVLRQRKMAYEETQRGLEERGKLATTQATERTVGKPETFESGGARYISPYTPGAGGAPGTYGPLTLAPGSPKPKEEPLTEAASKNVQFVTRTMRDLEAFDTEHEKGKVLTNPSEHATYNNPLIPNAAARMMVSSKYNSALNAIGNWGAALMTHVSGAAVSPSEALRQLPAYVPGPGDTQKQLDEKAERRRDMTAGVGATAGSAGRTIIEKFQDDMFAKEAAKPPIAVKTPDDTKLLPGGRKIVLPDGSIGQVPKRKLWE